ncbi:MAG TPA: H(+)/Cl(-) exchange transporter ClcA [Stellaceae bacterium]|nr:H(+)/Cl(-) exchange transporter ClcA [Stellaceae bacterium]
MDDASPLARGEKTAPEQEQPEIAEEALHHQRAPEHHLRRLLLVSLLAPLVGAGAGFVDAVFRLTLEQADRLRNLLIARGHDAHFLGFLLVVLGCAAAAAFAAWLVRRFSPHASGSGIPQVEAALNDELPPAPPRLLPVKFLGGLSAIGAGMALGREGPSVQMGAVVAHLVGQLFRHTKEELRLLLAAGAGAGLAVAFNAPIAGAVFVLEELVRRFEPRMTIVALATSSTAIMISRLFLGNAPDFHVAILAPATVATGPLPYASEASWLLYVALGIIAGGVASLYNRSILGALTLTGRLRRVPVEARAAVIGAAVGVVGWFFPKLIGGGDDITQNLLAGGVAVGAIPLGFLVRFCLGPISYAARTPGGLFAPLLVLGAQLGLLFGAFCARAFPHLGIAPEAFAVVGMAAFFTGIVQAPVTGIVLVTEMTAAFTTLLPMLAACFAAMLVAHLLRTTPIYDSLLERLIEEAHPQASLPGLQRVTI